MRKTSTLRIDKFATVRNAIEASAPSNTPYAISITADAWTPILGRQFLCCISKLQVCTENPAHAMVLYY
ncbi:hypothetical protein [Rubripirellula reticaptiva]|uniref:hypothetical protein n=1 Tax=Rubripirellula reticaptiva TaxID=2528013 RepID=UPI0011B83EBE|nr:hypothetical protein [Rubripirellula reticaptiva]